MYSWRLALECGGGVAAAVLALGGCATSTTTLWSFDSAELSSDGQVLVVDSFPGNACYEFSHVELEERGNAIMMSLHFTEPPRGSFCPGSCPIELERIEIALDVAHDPDLPIVMNPETEPHCAETIVP